MSEIRHLQTKIIIFEDMMFRCKNFGEQLRIREEIIKMRLKLRNMERKGSQK